MGLSTWVLNRITWFYVGFVFVSFALLLWLFISGYLTIYTGLPLPYFMLYTTGNVAITALVTMIVILGLYVYLGIVLIRSGFSRGYVPIGFVASIIIGMVLILTGQFVAAVVFLIIALVLQIGSYAVLTSIATNKVSMYMWLIGALLILAAAILTMINRLLVNYIEAVIQSLSILACTVEVWSIMGKRDRIR
ncbi:hypothetical protein [Caldivirga maquilingensis]|uniref:Uncharacterized protein n=1 Tax=Caldivirga maquilingensis (strain ATCC 700844 / DSM 13496 / JCM 10307 / IC-167) TaxID=397948 RepID=A8MA41_CALMQ|nr:hypothetical protein [Caldivirga maquilingensis]ABW00973.1 hypothetical protein Cmaq_0120 [Caldivirga maquilingensis IC-167]